MGATKQWGEGGRWLVIGIIHILKYDFCYNNNDSNCSDLEWLNILCIRFCVKGYCINYKNVDNLFYFYISHNFCHP